MAGEIFNDFRFWDTVNDRLILERNIESFSGEKRVVFTVTAELGYELLNASET
jgi:hypothetical protein